MEKEFEALESNVKICSKYYVVYKVMPTTNPYIENRTNLFIVKDEKIAKDFCQKYGFEYKEEEYCVEERVYCDGKRI